MPTCIICKNNILKKIWHEKIRKSAKKFTKKKEKIFQCSNCDLVFLENKRKSLEDLSKTRNIFNNTLPMKKYQMAYSTFPVFRVSKRVCLINNTMQRHQILSYKWQAITCHHHAQVYHLNKC